MVNIRTHYDNLRVARNAPDIVIKAAYKALCQTYHPDKFQGDNAKAERIMKLINTSYSVLIDPVKRAEHDAWIQAQEKAEATPQSEKAQFSETGNGTEQEFYQKQETKKQYTPPPKEPEPEQTQANTSLHLWRRYFARYIIDYSISGIVLVIFLTVWSAINPSFPNLIIAQINNPELSPTQQMVNWSFISTVFWVILEPICLSLFGTTAGKALFRLRLVSDNTKPNYWKRSIAVWAVGMGFGILFVAGLCMLNAANQLKKNGQTAWDKWNGFSVEAEPIGMVRGVSLTALVLLLIVVNAQIGNVWKQTIPSQQPIQQAQAVQSVPQAATPQGIFQRAVDLYNQGRYAEALPLYQGLAEQGDVKAQFNLAFMYDIGLGVAQNYTQAAYWIGKAAEQGDAQAQFMLGVMYVLGRGVAQNDAQAAYWYGKAAEQGNTNAIAALKELRQ